MADDIPHPLDAFESWLLQRVAQAVEAGHVSAELLTELHTEFKAAQDKSQAESHAHAVQDIAEALEIPLKRAEEVLAFLEAQPPAAQGWLLRRVAEAWLAQVTHTAQDAAVTD